MEEDEAPAVEEKPWITGGEQEQVIFKRWKDVSFCRRYNAWVELLAAARGVLPPLYVVDPRSVTVEQQQQQQQQQQEGAHAHQAEVLQEKVEHQRDGDKEEETLQRGRPQQQQRQQQQAQRRRASGVSRRRATAVAGGEAAAGAGGGSSAAEKKAFASAAAASVLAPAATLAFDVVRSSDGLRLQGRLAVYVQGIVRLQLLEKAESSSAMERPLDLPQQQQETAARQQQQQQQQEQQEPEEEKAQQQPPEGQQQQLQRQQQEQQQQEQQQQEQRGGESEEEEEEEKSGTEKEEATARGGRRSSSRASCGRGRSGRGGMVQQAAARRRSARLQQVEQPVEGAGEQQKEQQQKQQKQKQRKQKQRKQQQRGKQAQEEEKEKEEEDEGKEDKYKEEEEPGEMHVAGTVHLKDRVGRYNGYVKDLLLLEEELPRQGKRPRSSVKAAAATRAAAAIAASEVRVNEFDRGLKLALLVRPPLAAAAAAEAEQVQQQQQQEQQQRQQQQTRQPEETSVYLDHVQEVAAPFSPAFCVQWPQQKGGLLLHARIPVEVVLQHVPFNVRVYVHHKLALEVNEKQLLNWEAFEPAQRGRLREQQQQQAPQETKRLSEEQQQQAAAAAAVGQQDTKQEIKQQQQPAPVHQQTDTRDNVERPAATDKLLLPVEALNLRDVASQQQQQPFEEQQEQRSHQEEEEQQQQSDVKGGGGNPQGQCAAEESEKQVGSIAASVPQESGSSSSSIEKETEADIQMLLELVRRGRVSDAASIWHAGAFEERFFSFRDRKPFGPTAVGVDITMWGAAQVYGLFEHAAAYALQKQQELYRLYNLDVFGYSPRSTAALYGSVPFVMALHASPTPPSTPATAAPASAAASAAAASAAPAAAASAAPAAAAPGAPAAASAVAPAAAPAAASSHAGDHAAVPPPAAAAGPSLRATAAAGPSSACGKSPPAAWVTAVLLLNPSEMWVRLNYDRSSCPSRRGRDGSSSSNKTPRCSSLHRTTTATSSSSSYVESRRSSEGGTARPPSPQQQHHEQQQQRQQEQQAIRSWWVAESGALDFFFFTGPTPQDVHRQYHLVTGLPAMAPLFALGKHQCRWNYVDEADARGVDEGFTHADIPYDVLWLDIEHTDGKRYFTWDAHLFPHPKALQQHLASQHRQLVVTVDPHLRQDGKYFAYRQALSRRLLVRDASGGVFVGACWPPGKSVYPDFMKAETRRWWASLFAFDVYKYSTPSLWIWNDMNEPSVFGGPELTLSKDALHLDGSVEHREVHNLYGYYNHRSTYEGLLARSNGTKRPFVLTRSVFVGSHRFGFVWTGDTRARWDYLAEVTPQMLSAAACGISAVGADVGGFFGDPSQELLLRWHQLAAFTPFYRSHSHKDSKRREPWLFGEEMLRLIRDTVLLRYRLLPFWYTLFAEYALLGDPVIRPLWWLDPLSPCMQQHEQAFLVGSAVSVHPVLRPLLSDEGQQQPSEMEVLLANHPGGVWYDLHSGLPFFSAEAAKAQRGRGEQQMNVPCREKEEEESSSSSTAEGGEATTGAKAEDVRGGTAAAAEEEEEEAEEAPSQRVMWGVSMNNIPVFVRGGQILVTKENVKQSSAFMLQSPYTLHIYPAAAGETADRDTCCCITGGDSSTSRPEAETCRSSTSAEREGRSSTSENAASIACSSSSSSEEEQMQQQQKRRRKVAVPRDAAGGGSAFGRLYADDYESFEYKKQQFTYQVFEYLPPLERQSKKEKKWESGGEEEVSSKRSRCEAAVREGKEEEKGKDEEEGDEREKERTKEEGTGQKQEQEAADNRGTSSSSHARNNSSSNSETWTLRSRPLLLPSLDATAPLMQGLFANKLAAAEIERVVLWGVLSPPRRVYFTSTAAAAQGAHKAAARKRGTAATAAAKTTPTTAKKTAAARSEAAAATEVIDLSFHVEATAAPQHLSRMQLALQKRPYYRVEVSVQHRAAVGRHDWTIHFDFSPAAAKAAPLQEPQADTIQQQQQQEKEQQQQEPVQQER